MRRTESRGAQAVVREPRSVVGIHSDTDRSRVARSAGKSTIKDLGLSHHGPNSTHLIHHPLGHPGSAFNIRRQQLAGHFSQIKYGGTGFEHREAAIVSASHYDHTGAHENGLEKMSRLSERVGKSRLAGLAGLVAVAAGAWIVLHEPEVDLISEERVMATVIDLPRSRIRSEQPSANNPSVGIILVELADGGRARIVAPLAKVFVGGEITLTVKQFSDGSRRVVGADDAN